MSFFVGLMLEAKERIDAQNADPWAARLRDFVADFETVSTTSLLEFLKVSHKQQFNHQPLAAPEPKLKKE